MLGKCVLLAAAALSMLSACGGEAPAEEKDEPTAPPRCNPPNRLVGTACLAPGVQDDGCPAGTMGLEDGTCRPAGVPAEACGVGFEPSADGCFPILPPRACDDGLMAIPGETACRQVMPCGEGSWGDLPLDATTEFVDGSYAGADSDGSADKPWTTIGDALAAAASGAIVAVAAGSYPEDLVLAGRPARLWGRCPSMVEVTPPPGEVAIGVIGGADGSEIRGLATRDADLGILISDAKDVIVDQVWVHDADFTGIQVTDIIGPASAAISRSLVERASEVGILVAGADVTIETTAVRDTRAGPNGKHGYGVMVQLDPDKDTPASLSLGSSVMDRNRGAGVMSAGANIAVDSCVVRDTKPEALDLRYGRGINLIQADGVRTSAEVHRSFVAGSHHGGVYVIGSDVLVENTVIVATQPQVSNHAFGQAVQAWDDQDVHDPSTITLRSLLLADNHDAGVLIGGSSAEIEGVLVRNSVPLELDLYSGYGLVGGMDPDTLVPGSISVKGSRIEGAHDAAILVYEASAIITGTIAIGTAGVTPSIGGDGVMAYAPPSLLVESSVLGYNDRAGFSIFGAGSGVVGSTDIQCNGIALNADPLDGVAPMLEDGGGNRCGCDGASEACRVQTTGLSPPQPIVPAGE